MDAAEAAQDRPAPIPIQLHPAAPTGLLVTATTENSASLSWNAATDNIFVAGYTVFRNGIQTGSTEAKSFTDTGLSSGTTYTYSVTAYDNAGNTSAQSGIVTATTSSINTGDTLSPTAPINLQATVVSSGQVNLTWNASTDDVGVTGYESWQGTNLIATVTTPDYHNTGLDPDTFYTYTVKAVDDAGNVSSASEAAGAKTLAVTPLDTTPPSTPTNLAATALSQSSIQLIWDPSTDNVSVTGYKVLLNTVSIATVTTNSYTDTGLASNTTYSYAVKAFDSAGNISEASGPASSTTFGGSSPDILVLSAVTARAGDTVTVSINPGSNSVYGTVSVMSWYPWMYVPIASVQVCPDDCTSATFADFTVPLEWIAGGYNFCVTSPQTYCRQLYVTNEDIVIDQGTCTAVSHQGTSDQKLDIVFVANNFSSSELDLFNSKVNDYTAALLSVTPFAENSGKINIWKVERQGSVQPDFAEVYYPGPDFWGAMVSRCGGADVVALIEGPACTWIPGVAFSGDAPPWLMLHNIYAGDTFVHEFGHAFGGLGDEYGNSRIYATNFETDLRANTDVAFCPKWCSGEPNTAATLPNAGFSCWTAWETFTTCITNAGPALNGDAVDACWTEASDLHNGWFAGIEMCDFGTDCAAGTGCFWNAKATNLFRSTRLSIMSGADLSTGFNAPSLEALQLKLDNYQ